MKEPPLPPDEAERQESLDRLEIVDTPAEERFDRITRLARTLFNVPTALISLVDRDRQWFKSAQGLAAPETPRAISFCGHAIQEDSAFVVADALRDGRFADNPLVTGSPNIRFYAGQPVRAPDGQRVGTLCLIDDRPRRLSPEARQGLRDLAALVESELRVNALSVSQIALRSRLEAVERKAAIDPVTRAWTRAMVVELLQSELARSKRQRQPLAVVMLDLDNFKTINDTYGHPGGDEVLRVSADRMRAEVRPYDVVGRYGGEEFMILIQAHDGREVAAVAERIRARLAELPVATSAGAVRITASLGVAVYDGTSDPDEEALVGAADRALYRAKSKGKNRVEFA